MNLADSENQVRYKKRNTEDTKILNLAKKNHFEMSLVCSFLVPLSCPYIFSLLRYKVFISLPHFMFGVLSHFWSGVRGLGVRGGSGEGENVMLL